MRGSKTHGGGAMKKRRGAGNRGGRGMAGTGKRGDGKKPSIWKNSKYFGVHGFSSHKKHDSSVNIAYIEGRAETLVKEGLIKKEGETYVIDLNLLGYQKLLGKGNVTRKYNITCSKASPSVIEKVKNSGGLVTVDN